MGVRPGVRSQLRGLRVYVEGGLMLSFVYHPRQGLHKPFEEADALVWASFSPAQAAAPRKSDVFSPYRELASRFSVASAT